MSKISEKTTAKRAPYKREMHFWLHGEEVSERAFWEHVRLNASCRGGEYRLVAEIPDSNVPGGYTPTGYVLTEKGRRALAAEAPGGEDGG